MHRELVLDSLVGLHGDLRLALVLLDLGLELHVQRRRRHAAPLLAVLPTQLVVNLLFIIEQFVHLRNQLEVVIANGTDALYHALNVAVAAFLLKVFNFLPQILRDLGGRCGSMICLRQPVLLKKLFLLALGLLLGLKLLIDNLL